LYQQGIKVHLHYLKCTEGPDLKIGGYCESLYSYHNGMEMNIGLKERLSIDNFPVLVEGNFCSEISELRNVKDRKVLVRLHDMDLKKFESPPSRQSLLEKFLQLRSSTMNQAGFQRNHLYICISEKKAEMLKQQEQLSDVKWLPPFVAWQKIKGEEG
jgi:hypothetical protein